MTKLHLRRIIQPLGGGNLAQPIAEKDRHKLLILLHGKTRFGRNIGENEVLLISGPSKAPSQQFFERKIEPAAKTEERNLISRTHAGILELSDENGESVYVVEDLSLNGTYVNDIRVLKKRTAFSSDWSLTRITEGDIIKFGHMNGAANSPGVHAPQANSEFTFIVEKANIQHINYLGFEKDAAGNLIETATRKRLSVWSRLSTIRETEYDESLGELQQRDQEEVQEKRPEMHPNQQHNQNHQQQQQQQQHLQQQQQALVAVALAQQLQNAARSRAQTPQQQALAQQPYPVNPIDLMLYQQLQQQQQANNLYTDMMKAMYMQQAAAQMPAVTQANNAAVAAAAAAAGFGAIAGLANNYQQVGLNPDMLRNLLTQQYAAQQPQPPPQPQQQAALNYLNLFNQQQIPPPQPQQQPQPLAPQIQAQRIQAPPIPIAAPPQVQQVQPVQPIVQQAAVAVAPVEVIAPPNSGYGLLMPVQTSPANNSAANSTPRSTTSSNSSSTHETPHPTDPDINQEQGPSKTPPVECDSSVPSPPKQTPQAAIPSTSTAAEIEIKPAPVQVQEEVERNEVPWTPPSPAEESVVQEEEDVVIDQVVRIVEPVQQEIQPKIEPEEEEAEEQVPAQNQEPAEQQQEEPEEEEAGPSTSSAPAPAEVPAEIPVPAASPDLAGPSTSSGIGKKRKRTNELNNLLKDFPSSFSTTSSKSGRRQTEDALVEKMAKKEKKKREKAAAEALLRQQQASDKSGSSSSSTSTTTRKKPMSQLSDSSVSTSDDDETTSKTAAGNGNLKKSASASASSPAKKRRRNEEEDDEDEEEEEQSDDEPIVAQPIAKPKRVVTTASGIRINMAKLVRQKKLEKKKKDAREGKLNVKGERIDGQVEENNVEDEEIEEEQEEEEEEEERPTRGRKRGGKPKKKTNADLDACGLFNRCKVGVDAETVQWVQCDDCSQWWHNICRFGNNEHYTKSTFSCCPQPTTASTSKTTKKSR